MLTHSCVDRILDGHQPLDWLNVVLYENCNNVSRTVLVGITVRAEYEVLYIRGTLSYSQSFDLASS